jgi:outer membrane immunogenic protein
MKKIMIGVVGSMVLGAAPALAADLPVRAPTKAPVVVPSPVYDWSGFYVGLNAGGGSSHECWDLMGIPPGAFQIVSPAALARAIADPSRFIEGCHSATGGTVGGQIGYHWQAANWVFGLEAQGNWADFKGSNASLSGLVGNTTNQTKVDAFGFLTGPDRLRVQQRSALREGWCRRNGQ